MAGRCPTLDCEARVKPARFDYFDPTTVPEALDLLTDGRIADLLLDRVIGLDQLVDDGLEALVQRRAAGKYHSALLWANACCTHPRWGEAPADCARRRLAEELGLAGLDLAWRERLTYRAEVGDGLVEHEEVDVFLARTAAEPRLAPDPAEVAEVRWLPVAGLASAIAADPAAFAPWLRIYLDRHAGRIFGGLIPDPLP
jgi:isopentenyl-diphosphate delta-isomerase